MDSAPDVLTSRRGILRWAVAAAGLAGAVLFALSIRSAGVGAVVHDVRRLGSAVLIIWLLGGLRHLARSLAWRLCFERAAPSVSESFAAYVCGDAIGNVTPFGALISEPSKVMLTRGRTPGALSIPALAIENLFYAVSAALMMGIGGVALFAALPISSGIRALAIGGVVATFTVSAAVTLLLMGRMRGITGRPLGALGKYADTLRAIEDRVLNFASRHPGRVFPIASLELAYHALAVFEIWFTLSVLGGTWASASVAIALEGVERAITIAFQFVPMWIGVDEAGTGAVAGALRLGAATGVSLALARKTRIMFWTALGLLLWWTR